MPQVRDAKPADDYADRLGKILPAELTATYFLLRSFAGNSAQLTVYLVILALVLAGAFYVVAPRLLAMETSRNRILYVITFLFWATAIDPSRIATDVLQLDVDNVTVFIFLASGLAAIWSFVVPFLMDERSAP
jgi:hypothetical protein